MPRLLAHITKTKRAPLHRSCDGGRSSRDLVLDSVGEGKDRSPCTSQAHAKARQLAGARGGVAPQSWAKGFFSSKLMRGAASTTRPTSRVLSGGAGADELHTAKKKTCGAFEGS